MLRRGTVAWVATGLSLALGAAPGCGDNLDSPEMGPRGGKRLQLIVMRTPDGAVIPGGFHDSQLDFDCTFRTAADGVVRCMPAISPFWRFLYGDPGCTGLAGGTEVGCRAPRYVPLPSDARCGSTQYAEVGEAYVPTGQTYLGDSDCSAYGAPPEIHRLGPALDLSAFVAAHGKTAPGVGRLAPRYLEADDGARRPLMSFYDKARGELCSVEPAIDGSDHCMPSASAAYSYDYSDPGCTKAVGEAPTTSCPWDTPARYVADFEDGDCSTRNGLRLYQIGPATTTLFAYDFSVPATCQAVLPSPGVRYFSEGPPIPPDSFEQVYDGPAPGSTRLRPFQASTPEGEAQPDFSPWLWDTARGEYCRPARASDGQVRCLPYGERTWTYYLDSSCTRPIQVIDMDGSCYGDPPSRYAIRYVGHGPSCDFPFGTNEYWDLDDPFDYYEVGDRITDPLYDNYRGCEPFSTAGGAYYPVGDRIDPSVFEPVQVSVE